MMFILPYLTANTPYTPTLALSPSPSYFTIPGAGHGTFAITQYHGHVPMHNSTSLIDGTTGDTNTSLASFRMSIAWSYHYSVYTNVTVLGWDYDFNKPVDSRVVCPSPITGNQSTLTVPHCTAFNTFRASVIAFSVMCWVHMVLACWMSLRMLRYRTQRLWMHYHV